MPSAATAAGWRSRRRRTGCSYWRRARQPIRTRASGFSQPSTLAGGGLAAVQLDAALVGDRLLAARLLLGLPAQMVALRRLVPRYLLAGLGGSVPCVRGGVGEVARKGP